MQFFVLSFVLRFVLQFVFVSFVCPVIVIERGSCRVLLDAMDILIRLKPELV